MKFSSSFFSLVAIVFLESIGSLHAQRLALVKTQFIGGTNYGVSFFNNSQSIATKDGGIIICGMVRDTGSGDLPHQPHPANDSGDVLLIKLDNYGNKQWVKSYGGPGIEGPKSICQTPDGGYALLTGSPKRAGDFAFDRVDAMGNFLWSSKNYGSSRQEGFGKIISTPDHGFLMSGISLGADGDIPYNYKMPITSFQPADFILLKTDSLGNKQWVKVLGTSGDENLDLGGLVTDGTYYYFINDAPTIDHDCVDSLRLALGFTGYSPYVFKLDASGNKIWTKAVGVGGVSSAIFDPRDSTIVCVGDGSPMFDFQGGHGSEDVFMFKIDRLGKFKWGRLYGGPNYDYGIAANIHLAPGGGYYLTGLTGPGNGTADGWLFLTDSVGNQLSDNLFGSLGDQACVTGVQGVSDGVVVIGQANSYQFTEGTGHNYNYSDASMSGYPPNVFVAHFQLWPAGVNHTQLKNGLKLFPNPAHQQFSIELPNTGASGKLRCMNNKGQLVFEQNTSLGQQRASIITADWPAGAYIVSWQDAAMNAPITAKLLIQ